MKIENVIIVRSILAIVLGFVLVMWPDAAVNYLVILIGILFMLPGLYAIIHHFVRPVDLEGGKRIFPIEAAGSVLLGAWLVSTPTFFVNLLMYVLGGILCVASLQQFRTLIRARKWSQVPLGFYLMPTLLLLTGLMILAYPFDAVANTFVIFGLAILFYGACELINAYKFKKNA